MIFSREKKNADDIFMECGAYRVGPPRIKN
jgi:hypothetical protein